MVEWGPEMMMESVNEETEQWMALEWAVRPVARDGSDPTLIRVLMRMVLGGLWNAFQRVLWSDPSTLVESLRVVLEPDASPV